MSAPRASSEICHVVAGVLRDGEGRVLITQRPAGKPLAGYWEFPGGKLADEEGAEQALARELTEELGVHPTRWHRLLRLRHDYPDRRVELEVFVVDAYQGEPVGREAQALKWVPAAQLHQEALLPADQPIIGALLAASPESTEA